MGGQSAAAAGLAAATILYYRTDSYGRPHDTRILESLMSYSSDVICVIDPHGRFQRVSTASLSILGYDSDEMVGKSFGDIMHPADRQTALAQCLRTYQSAPMYFDSRCLKKDGREVGISWSAFKVPADGVLLCVGRDTTSERQPPPTYGHEALNEVFIGHGFDMVGLLTEEGVYTYVGGATLKTTGYRSEDLIGRSCFSLIHPDDLPQVLALWNQIGVQKNIQISDFRFQTASGEWKWIQTTVSNQLHNPAIRAYAVSSRDVSEQKRASFELAESEQRMRLLFENNPALAVFQSTEGLILDANPAFLSFFKKQKPEVVYHPLAEFLPHSLRLLFEQSFREAAGGRRAKFVAAVNNEAGEERHLRVKHVPLVVQGEIVGVHVMAKDITNILTAQRLIKQQAEQLTTILESMTDAFFSLDKNWNITYLNRETERVFAIKRKNFLGRCIWEVFPDPDPIYRSSYQQARDTNQTVQFRVFEKLLNCWLQFKVFPSPDGLAVYFSDVTEQVSAEKKLKQLALVASGTDNSVIITDAQGITEWVNEGFTKHTGYVLADMVGKTPGQVLQGAETDPATIERIRERLLQQKACHVTILNYKKSGQKLWFAMDITPIYDDSGQLMQFISIQQNITYRKEIEASQAKMTQDLYRQNRDLQQFTYVLSHNLRAPLANALGLANVLTKVDKNSAAFTNSLAMLGQSMKQVDTVLHDLNLILSLRDNQDVQPPETVALADVCREAIEHLAGALEQCGGRVELRQEEGLSIHGNKAFLYSIFYNLLSNSIKYRSPERSLLVEISWQRTAQGGISISFTDNGSGFDTYKAGSDVFQLYKRFHTNQRGRGIGLFLVKTHVEAMGGKIEVTSAVNAGTRFLIHLDAR
ncbi:PAS domain S-box protein [Hymenobacter sp. BRD67]|uniref:PAS domain S-box protein n=1 Tax=Hymenobacter sp. BRD67 TaxID=2675877 RepID=UPI0015663108|nr:PAS domain S-box protein [Hymenobacter sp. BRD67]QKG51376.1 PAS domain S-box protein [Hymenobacter sp. BRD67]